MPEEAIKPFRVDVPQATLDDLKARLKATRYPQQIDNDDWAYGMEMGYLKKLCQYWADDFDWRKQETLLNSFDQYMTHIDGHDIHFIHQRAKNPDATPILISHGWPGTISEFLQIIAPLSDPEAHGGKAEDAFHVICPSLPGYGFSGPTQRRGINPVAIAKIFAQLMERLGYSRYIAQGGDWGAVITSNLGVLDAEHLQGIHLNMPMAMPKEGVELSPQEQADVEDMASFDFIETGYQKIQGTKPQTLGVGLNDSPAGLAAWIGEKFRTWTDNNGDLKDAVNWDALLTNITIYWVTESICSSTRLYYETFNDPTSVPVLSLNQKVEVPTGVARYPKEMMRFPRAWVEQHYNVTHWKDMPEGGHFAAMEEPTLFIDDIRAFRRSL